MNAGAFLIGNVAGWLLFPWRGGFGGDGIIGGWEGFRTGFGHVFPCFEVSFLVAMLLGDHFGYFGTGLIERVRFGE